MAIAFNCNGCGKHYEVSDNLAGKRAKCKQCSQQMLIPSAPASASALDDIYGLDEGPSMASAAPLSPLPRRGGAVAEPEAPVKKKKKKGGFFGGSKSKSKDSKSGAQAAGLGVGGVVFIIVMICVRIGLRQGVNHLFGGLSGKGQVEKFVKDDISEMNELTLIFNSAHDEGTANIAVNKAIPVIERMISRYREFKDKKALQTDIDAVNAQYGGQVQSSSQAMQASMTRFATLPGAQGAFSRLIPYFDRMVEVLPAEQQAAARQGLHPPNPGAGMAPPQFSPPPQFNPPPPMTNPSPPMTQPSGSPPPQFNPPPPNQPGASGFPPGGNPNPQPGPAVRTAPQKAVRAER